MAYQQKLCQLTGKSCVLVFVPVALHSDIDYPAGLLSSSFSDSRQDIGWSPLSPQQDHSNS